MDFDDSPPYNDAISDIFERNINAYIKFCHCYPYSTSKVIMITRIDKNSWGNTVKEFPKQLYALLVNKLII